MENKNHISYFLNLFKDINSGGLEYYYEEDQALILKLESNGGSNEDSTLFLKFNYVEYFHLPLSLDHPRFKMSGIDEIRAIKQKEIEELLPISDSRMIVSDYKCYRFYANGISTPFYIYCSELEGWLE